MFWLTWQLLGVLIAVAVIVVAVSIGWNILKWAISPSEREEMRGSGRFLLAVGIVGALVFFWLFWHR
jgi:hypothetical protein